MESRTRVVLVIGFFAVWGVNPVVGAKPGGTTSAAVEYREPALGIDGDRVDGDVPAAYTDGQNKVSAKIDSDAHNNDIVLDLSRTRGARALFIDLTDCAETSCEQRPFDQQALWDGVRVQTRAARLFDFEVGSTQPVRLWVKFVWEGSGWWLRLDAEDRETDCISHNATATRTSASEWVISAGNDQIACLLTITADGKEARGKFRIPHQFTVRVK